MNYIALINRFWNAEHTNTGQLNQYDTQLYFFLLNSCNEHYWKMPIGHSDRYLAGRLGMSVNTLRKSKDRLADMKLITYMVPEKASKGVAGQCRYSFPTVSPHDTVDNKKKSKTVSPRDTDNSTTVSSYDTVTETEPYHPVTQSVSPDDTDEEPTVSLDDTNNKTVLTDTEYKQENPTTIPIGIVGPEQPKKPKKEKEKEKISSAGAAPKNENTVPHWTVLVAAWFEFYKNQYDEEPTFKGSAPRDLKNILQNLQKKSEAKNFEWTEAQALSSFNVFLQYAVNSDKWLKENFMLSNLNRQFDKIIAYAKSDRAKKSMGRGVDLINGLYR